MNTPIKLKILFSEHIPDLITKVSTATFKQAGTGKAKKNNHKHQRKRKKHTHTQEIGSVRIDSQFHISYIHTFHTPVQCTFDQTGVTTSYPKIGRSKCLTASDQEAPGRGKSGSITAITPEKNQPERPWGCITDVVNDDWWSLFL